MHPLLPPAPKLKREYSLIKLIQKVFAVEADCSPLL